MCRQACRDISRPDDGERPGEKREMVTMDGIRITRGDVGLNSTEEQRQDHYAE